VKNSLFTELKTKMKKNRLLKTRMKPLRINLASVEVVLNELNKLIKCFRVFKEVTLVEILTLMPVRRVQNNTL
jgi:hypothetical protein